jgi:hypothetical protein
MNSVERTNGAMLLGILLGSAFTAFSLRRSPVAARYVASALGLLGAVRLARDLHGAAGISWDEAPGLVVANALVLSLWSSLFFSMILVASCASHPAAAPAKPGGQRGLRRSAPRS